MNKDWINVKHRVPTNTDTKIESASPVFTFDFSVYCPYCKHDIDLNEEEYINPIFNNKSVEGKMVYCNECDNDFILDEQEY